MSNLAPMGQLPYWYGTFNQTELEKTYKFLTKDKYLNKNIRIIVNIPTYDGVVTLISEESGE